MNQATLNCRLKVAEELDRFIREWKARHGHKPRVLYVTREQMAQMELHLVEGASSEKWEGIPLKVTGAAA
jgi:hypothetical protein